MNEIVKQVIIIITSGIIGLSIMIKLASMIQESFRLK